MYKMDEFKPLGELFADAYLFGLIYFTLLTVLVTALIVTVAVYIRKKHVSKDAGAVNTADNTKKLLPLRVTVIVIAGVLALLLIPLAII